MWAVRRGAVVLCVALATVSAVLAVLWAGVLTAVVFNNSANTWRGVPLVGAAANFLVFGGSTSSAHVYWLGGPVGAIVELALDVASTTSLAIGAVLTTLGLSRSWQAFPSRRSSIIALYVCVVTVFAIALDAVATIPAEAHDAAGFRAAHYLQAFRLNLVGEMTRVLRTADAQDAIDSAQRAKDVGHGYVKALNSFSDHLATISFPNWISGQLDAERTALTDAIVASSDLATAADGSQLAIQNAYQRLDDALQRENLANRALYLALFPAAYLKIFLPDSAA